MISFSFFLVKLELINFIIFTFFFSLPFPYSFLCNSFVPPPCYIFVTCMISHLLGVHSLISKQKSKQNLCRSQSQLDNLSKRDTGVSAASVRNQSSTVSSNLIRMPSAPSHTAEETRLLG